MSSKLSAADSQTRESCVSGSNLDCGASCATEDRRGGMKGFGFRIGLSLALAGQGMVFGLGYNNARLAGEAPPYGTPLYWGIHGGLILSSLGVIFLLGRPLFARLWLAVRHLEITVEALFFLSALGAFVGSLAATFKGTGNVYYEVVSIVLSVYAIGRQVGAVQKGKVGSALHQLRSSFQTVRVQNESGSYERRGVKEVVGGETVEIRPGEAVSVDGYILEGKGYVRETALTGEPLPVVRETGDFLRGGTFSVDGRFLLRASGGVRPIDRIMEMVEAAMAKPSNLQIEADRLMRFFVPGVALISLCTFLGWTFAGDGNYWNGLFNAMAVLLVACPCALGLAMPIGIWAGLFHLSQRGLIGRHGTLLDTLATANCLIFDKTGTLSELDPVCDLQGLRTENIPQKRLTALISSLARSSQHPVSEVLAAISPDSLAVSEIKQFSGEGLSGVVDGRQVLIGEATLLERFGVLVLELPVEKEKRVHVAIDGKYAGYITLREVFKTDMQEAFAALKHLGISCRILTGDPNFDENLFPDILILKGLSGEAKAEYVRDRRQKEGDKIIFVGDGLNDVQAMEASDAALAMDIGAALATESADGVLIGGRLEVLPAAIHQARKIRKGLQANIRFALFYNLFGMSIAAAGLLHPVVAAFLMVGSSFFVSARAIKNADM